MLTLSQFTTHKISTISLKHNNKIVISTNFQTHAWLSVIDSRIYDYKTNLSN